MNFKRAIRTPTCDLPWYHKAWITPLHLVLKMATILINKMIDEEELK